MRILIDILHPAHVHFFKNAIKKWQREGNNVLVTARDKDITLELLNAYGINYTEISKMRQGLLNLFCELVKRDIELYKIAKKFKPHILLGISGVSIALIGKLVKRPSIVFTDTEIAKLTHTISLPFADIICTPTSFKKELGKKHIKYNGYHELTYLHPDYFQPDESVLGEVNLKMNEKFVIMRFVSWQATHDIGQRKFGINDKWRFVEEIEKYAKIFITSEVKLPKKLRKYRITLSSQKIHDLLYFAQLYVGESATMASESAMLGVPAIFISPTRRGYTDELGSRYGMVYTFTSWKEGQNGGFKKAIELLKDTKIKEKWRVKRERMLKEKIDVTKFIINLTKETGERRHGRRLL